jgi:hypothetical protein
MDGHEEIRLDLAAYAASRLEGSAARRVEQHLEICLDCREIAETIKGLGASLRGGGESLFAPHPSESALREYADRRGRADGQAIAQHLAGCATCSLEVEVWTRKRAGAQVREPSTVSRSTRWRSLALASAAGIAVGFTLAVFLRAGRVPAVPPATPAATTATGAAPTAGRLLLLPRTLRGEKSVGSYALEPDQEFVVIGCPVSLPDGAKDSERFHYEIRKESGEAVWSQTMSAAATRRQSAGGLEVVTFLVPARLLPPGHYEFSLSPAERPDEVRYRVGFEITRGGDPQ